MKMPLGYFPFSDEPAKNAMTWIQTHSGRAVDLLRPKAEQIYLGDIVHALARINRFSGHTIGDVPYSVAVHAVHTCRLVRERLAPDDTDAQMLALWHDAPEAYTGDIGTPLQEALGMRDKAALFRRITAKFERLIFPMVGLTPARAEKAWPIVKRADLLALQGERFHYMSACPRPWRLPLASPTVPVPRPLRPVAAENLFLRTYRQLALETKSRRTVHAYVPEMRGR